MPPNFRLTYIQFLGFKIGIMMKSIIIVSTIVLLIQFKNFVFSRHLSKNKRINNAIISTSEKLSNFLPNFISDSFLYKFVGNVMFMNSMSVFHTFLIFMFTILSLDWETYNKAEYGRAPPNCITPYQWLTLVMVLVLTDEYSEVILTRHKGYYRYRIECYVASLLYLNCYSIYSRHPNYIPICCYLMFVIKRGFDYILSISVTTDHLLAISNTVETISHVANNDHAEVLFLFLNKSNQ